MSAPEIRVNYALLGVSAHRFGRAAQQIQKMYVHLQRAAGRLGQDGWEGKGAEAFQREMQSVVLPAVGRLAKALTHSQATTTRIMAILREAEEDAARLFQSDPKSISAEGVKGDGGFDDSNIISGGSFGESGASAENGKAVGDETVAKPPRSDSWYQAHGYEKQGNTWVYTGKYMITDAVMAEQVLAEAGITLTGSAWTEQNKIEAAQGVADMVGKIGKGYEHLHLLTGGDVEFFKGEVWEDPRAIPILMLNASDSNTPAYTLPSISYRSLPIFDGNTVFFAPHDPNAVSRYIVVHEIAHLIDWDYGLSRNLPEGPYVTPYAGNSIPPTRWEEWGEAVSVWVYGVAYKAHGGDKTLEKVSPAQDVYIQDALVNPKIENSKEENNEPALWIP